MATMKIVLASEYFFGDILARQKIIDDCLETKVVVFYEFKQNSN
jgi:hypothetical protein